MGSVPLAKVHETAPVKLDAPKVWEYVFPAVTPGKVVVVIVGACNKVPEPVPDPALTKKKP